MPIYGGTMAKAYSDDLRRKVLLRRLSGRHTLKDLAERFDVSLGWVKKVSAEYTRTGVRERRLPTTPSRQTKTSQEVEEFVRETLKSQPYITLMQLKALLMNQKQVHISIGTTWNLLKRLRLR